MKEIKKAILVLFKDYKELREQGTDYLLPIARRDDYYDPKDTEELQSKLKMTRC